MIEAWIITSYDISRSYYEIVFEEPDEYYYDNPNYKVERIVYSVIESK